MPADDLDLREPSALTEEDVRGRVPGTVIRWGPNGEPVVVATQSIENALAGYTASDYVEDDPILLAQLDGRMPNIPEGPLVSAAGTPIEAPEVTVQPTRPAQDQDALRDHFSYSVEGTPQEVTVPTEGFMERHGLIPGLDTSGEDIPIVPDAGQDAMDAWQAYIGDPDAQVDPSRLIQDPVMGTTTVTPTARRRRSGTASSVQYQRQYTIPGGDPELEARARKEEDRLAEMLASIRRGDARFLGDMANIDREAANELLEDREGLRAMVDERMTLQSEALNNLEQLNDRVMSQEIDPVRFFSTRGGARLGAAVSVALGSLGQALAPGTENAALRIIDTAVERDIAAQVENMRNSQQGVVMAQNIYQDLRQLYNDDFAAQAALRSMYLTEVDRRLNSLRASAASERMQGNADVLIQQIQARRARADAQLADRVGNIHVTETVRARGLASSRRNMRMAHRMQSDPNRRRVVNFARQRAGLQPLPEAAPRPRRSRARTGTGTARTGTGRRGAAQRQVPRGRGAQVWRPSDGSVETSPEQIPGSTVYGARGGPQTQMRVPRQAPNGGYIFRLRDGTMSTIPAGTAVPPGASQLFEVIQGTLEAATEADLAAEQLGRGMRIPGSDRVVPGAVWARMGETTRTNALAEVQGMLTYMRSINSLFRTLRDADAQGRVPYTSAEAVRRIQEELADVRAAGAFGGAMGVIGDREAAVLAAIRPQSYRPGSWRAQYVALRDAVQDQLETNIVWEAGNPAHSTRQTPPTRPPSFQPNQPGTPRPAPRYQTED
jgi:hypothetical protein